MSRPEQFESAAQLSNPGASPKLVNDAFSGQQLTFARPGEGTALSTDGQTLAIPSLWNHEASVSQPTPSAASVQSAEVQQPTGAATVAQTNPTEVTQPGTTTAATAAGQPDTSIPGTIYNSPQYQGGYISYASPYPGGGADTTQDTGDPYGGKMVPMYMRLASGGMESYYQTLLNPQSQSNAGAASEAPATPSQTDSSQPGSGTGTGTGDGTDATPTVLGETRSAVQPLSALNLQSQATG